MQLSSRVIHRVIGSIRFSVWLVTGYADVFILLLIAIANPAVGLVLVPIICDSSYCHGYGLTALGC